MSSAFFGKISTRERRKKRKKKKRLTFDLLTAQGRDRDVLAGEHGRKKGGRVLKRGPGRKKKTNTLLV